MPSLVELDLWFWWRKFLNVVNVFLLYPLIISPLDGMWPFVWSNLNLLYQRMLCAKFNLNWSSNWWRFLKLVNVFSLCRYFYYLPLEKSMAFHLLKLETLSAKDAFLQRLGQCFYRRKWKCEMFTDRQSDWWTTGDQKSSLQLSAQVSYKEHITRISLERNKRLFQSTSR